MKPIVVAVNGSATSLAALRWAADAARSEGRRLVVVTAFLEPFIPGEIVAASMLHLTASESDARRRARAVIDHVLEGDDVEWEHVVAMASIDDLLRRVADDAEMIVVGTRPATWRTRLRGSVSRRLSGRVPCPVVAIPLAPEPLAA